MCDGSSGRRRAGQEGNFEDGKRDEDRPCTSRGVCRLSFNGHSSGAQTYPTRQIRLVVPFAAGGPADLLARVLADEMSKDLGQQVFVDNRPGANTIIGAELVAKADPDGYTLLMAIDGTLVMNPFLYSKLSYDPFKDFAPVTLVARVPSVIEANKSVTASTVEESSHRKRQSPAPSSWATAPRPRR